MATLSRQIVEQIRVMYASGLYHKADLAIRFATYMDNPLDIVKVLDYNIFKDVREDLRMSLYGMAYVFEAADEYHHKLRLAAMYEFENVLVDPKNAPAEFQKIKAFEERKVCKKLLVINKEFNLSFSLYDIQSRIYMNL